MVDMPNIVCEGCGKKYRWKPELAGKKVKCKCGQMIEIPVPPKAGNDPNDDSFGAIELADVGSSSHSTQTPDAPAASSKPKTKPPGVGEVKIAGGDIEPIRKARSEDDSGRCPSCGTPQAAETVVCIQCGFNRKTGKKLGTEHGEVQVEGMLDKLKGLFQRKSK